MRVEKSAIKRMAVYFTVILIIFLFSLVFVSKKIEKDYGDIKDSGKVEVEYFNKEEVSGLHIDNMSSNQIVRLDITAYKDGKHLKDYSVKALIPFKSKYDYIFKKDSALNDIGDEDDIKIKLNKIYFVNDDRISTIKVENGEFNSTDEEYRMLKSDIKYICPKILSSKNSEDELIFASTNTTKEEIINYTFYYKNSDNEKLEKIEFKNLKPGKTEKVVGKIKKVKNENPISSLQYKFSSAKIKDKDGDIKNIVYYPEFDISLKSKSNIDYIDLFVGE